MEKWEWARVWQAQGVSSWVEIVAQAQADADVLVMVMVMVMRAVSPAHELRQRLGADGREAAEALNMAWCRNA